MAVGFDEVIADFESIAEEVFRRAADLLLEELIEAAPVASGFLRDSIDIEILEIGSGSYEMRLIVEAEYADDLDTGTRPHVIEGRPVLRFQWPNAPAGVEPDEDGFVFFTRVDHPGSQKHVGWASDVIERWPEFLEEANQL